MAKPSRRTMELALEALAYEFKCLVDGGTFCENWRETEEKARACAELEEYLAEGAKK